MKKHGILLSLLVAFFAVFVTACENLPLEDMLEGSNQGGNTNPTLSFTYEKVNTMTYKFIGDLKNASPDDYTFTWKFGDEALLTDRGLEISHTFKNDAAHTVILVAEPKDASVTPPAAGYSDIVNASVSGIIVEDFNYSNVSGLEFSFEVAASSIDGDALTYTWDFGDGEKLENSDQKVVTHKFPKFNATYPVSLVITSANGNTLNVPATEIKTSDLKAVITVVNNPENASSKTFSVNILDENDNIIHGSSTTSGDITGLTNVSYSWNFGDGQSDKTADRTVEHTYTTSTSDVYDVTVSVTTDNYDNAITATAEANVELSYSVPELITSLTGDYGLTIQASAKGFGGVKFANQQATYEFTFPNGVKQTKTVTHDAEGNLAEAVVVTANLEKYYSNYPVTLEVKNSNGVVIATSTANATKPSFVYDLTIGNGGSYYTKVFTATPKAGSAFLLKDAAYNWSYGDGASEKGAESVSHTYNRPGTFNVTVNISSPLLADTNITVKPVTKTVTLSQSITINSLNCKTDGAEYKFLQYTCTVDATASNGATPTYKWYVDNAVQSNQTANTFTKKYDKYNKTYTIKVEVGVKGISGVTPVTKTFALGTPAVWALMTGPNYLTHGQEGIYTVVPKVTHNGITTDVTLNGANYTFKIKENGGSENLGSSSKWTRAFEPTNEQYNGSNSVTRTITAVITANNINASNITSTETVTTINKPVGTVADFQSAVISCSPANDGVNLAKQQCKVTLRVKDNSAANGNFNEYKAKLTSNGVTKSVTFDDKALAAGASQVSTSVDFDFALPNGGDVVTGQAKSANYKVTGYVYKGVNEATKLTATAGNVNINLNVDYVIFPYPTGLEGKSGGSGYNFATWSCGYNERYGQGTLVGSKCASNASNSGQTLRLGSYVDANGNLKGKTRFAWYIRINKANGQNIPMTKISEFVVNKGSKPSDAQIKFNITKALQYKQFIGSAYNNTTNTIFLQITPADDPNAKPVRVWYNGSNKGNYGNRLQKITPTVRDEHTCEVLFEYPNKFYPTIRYIQVYLRQFRYNFDGASRYNSMDFVIPSDTTYRPIIRVTSNIQGIDSLWSQRYVDDYNGYGIRESTDYWIGGWSMYLPELIKLRREENARGNSNIDMTRTTATVDLLFKDMLQGSGSQLISGYYKTVSCKVSQSVK